MINVKELVAIDVHTHAEVSSRDAKDEATQSFEAAARKYFKETAPRPTIPEAAAYYRQRKIACVIFTVDSERATGRRRISNEEVAELAHENGDVMIPFASIDPARGKMGVREARRLIEDYGIKGFKFHPQVQEFWPNDRSVYGLYEVIAEARLPAIFHTGHSGMGTGMRGGGGVRLKYGDPMPIDDVAVDFPDMPIILAHPSPCRRPNGAVWAVALSPAPARLLYCWRSRGGACRALSAANLSAHRRPGHCQRSQGDPM